MLDRDELQAINGLTAELREFRSSLQTNRGNSNAEIHVNAGGVGVWVATTACLVMLGAGLIGSLWVSREMTRIETQFSNMKNTDDIHDAYIQKLRAQQQEKK